MYTGGFVRKLVEGARQTWSPTQASLMLRDILTHAESPLNSLDLPERWRLPRNVVRLDGIPPNSVLSSGHVYGAGVPSAMLPVFVPVGGGLFQHPAVGTHLDLSWGKVQAVPRVSLDLQGVIPLAAARVAVLSGTPALKVDHAPPSRALSVSRLSEWAREAVEWTTGGQITGRGAHLWRALSFLRATGRLRFMVIDHGSGSSKGTPIAANRTSIQPLANLTSGSPTHNAPRATL